MEREKTRLRFDRHGGFFIEVAVSPAEGVTMSWGEQIPLAKVGVDTVIRTHVFA